MAKIMNERIKELAEQAGIDFFGDHGLEATQANLQEFAELIIEECAFQCQHLGDMERIGKHFEVDVFKQFGV